MCKLFGGACQSKVTLENHASQSRTQNIIINKIKAMVSKSLTLAKSKVQNETSSVRYKEVLGLNPK